MIAFAFAAATVLSHFPQLPPGSTFTRVRSDGATLYCVQHAEKPSVFTPLIECNTLARWERLERTRGKHSFLVRDPSLALDSLDSLRLTKGGSGVVQVR